jgi:hypothetical protein
MHPRCGRCRPMWRSFADTSEEWIAQLPYRRDFAR